MRQLLVEDCRLAMQMQPLSHFLTGVSVPVFSLRTRRSCAVGEFADLVALGRWCVRVGLEVIQILPVNDIAGPFYPPNALPLLSVLLLPEVLPV
jgi:4-alpha-glucanotransferase